MSHSSRYLVMTQGVYYVLTGLWPLVSMSSFEAVTGPKLEDWLVHTVGVLAVAIGVTLLVATRRTTLSAETFTLAAGAAVAFASIDLVYALRGTISPIYLADAAVEVTFLAALLATRFSAAGLAGRAR
jgi:energy-converting hydrogenase Eha subunit E